eukprot:4844306-Pleurochrysis_carterae.AAC.1
MSANQFRACLAQAPLPSGYLLDKMKLGEAENWECFMSYKPAPSAPAARYSTPPFPHPLMLGTVVTVEADTPLLAVLGDVPQPGEMRA